ncbi:MAG: radical SAM protein [Candidatus Bathyarchaeia archaeon]
MKIRILAEPVSGWLHRAMLKPMKPVFGNFILSWRCNYRCVMCNNWRRNSAERLTPEELERLLESRWLDRLEVVSLTGGEPFLLDDLEDIIDVFKRKGIPTIGITTNASMPNRIREVMQRSVRGSGSNFYIHVSLDGPPEIHNAIRGVPRAFERVEETMCALRDIENLRVGVGMCIGSLNWNHIGYVREFARRHGASFVVGLAEAGWIFGQCAGGANLYTFTDEQKKVIANEMRRIGTWYAEGVVERLAGISKPIQCTAFWHGFTVAPDGSVHPCVNSSDVVGNIQKESFSSIWTSVKAREARSKVLRCSGCWSNCEMIYSYRYSFRRLTEAFRRGF